MQIGMYLQDKTKDESEMQEKFFQMLQAAKRSNLDLLVLPEGAYTPYDQELEKIALQVSGEDRFARKQLENIMGKIIKQSGCPLILSRSDKNGRVYSCYLNPRARKQETRSHYYWKQIAAEKSLLDSAKFSELVERVFSPIKLRGFLIGQTIFDDAVFPLFSRLYGRKKVDILINSSSGQVDYKKWSYYHKVRAIENKCTVLSTMAYSNPRKKQKAYVFAYDANGAALDYNIVNSAGEKSLCCYDGLYVFRPEKSAVFAQKPSGIDEFINQEENLNKNFDLLFNPREILKNRAKLKKAADNLYYFQKNDKTVVVAVIGQHDILKPEYTASLLYHKNLQKLPDKRYIVINEWQEIEPHFYEAILSNVLKVRAAENFCTVMLVSPNLVKCFQVSNNKNIQVVKMQKNSFQLDLRRMTGPEALWKTKANPLMKKEWRVNYEKLLDCFS